MKKLFILHHLGLGDHLICNGLYRVKLDSYDRCAFIVKQRNFATVRGMLADCSKIVIIPAPAKIADGLQKFVAKLFDLFGWEILALGSFGSGFFLSHSTKAFDQQFYEQAGVPFEARWSRSFIPRDSDREGLTKKELVGESENFIFIHEDRGRGFTIDPALVPSGGEVLRPSPRKGISFFSYCRLIEEASAVHLIGSSFLALSESLSLTGKRFVHQYARPETANDPRHRQSLRSPATHFERPVLPPSVLRD